MYILIEIGWVFGYSLHRRAPGLLPAFLLMGPFVGHLIKSIFYKTREAICDEILAL